MTEEEAKAKLQGFQNDSLGFCPLIEEGCKKTCVFYAKPYVKEIGGTDDFHVYGHCCKIIIAIGP